MSASSTCSSSIVSSNCSSEVHLKHTWEMLLDHRMTSKLVADTFVWMMKNHRYIMPVFQFGRRKYSADEAVIRRDALFQRHSVTVAQTITALVDSAGDPQQVASLACKLGQRHFYYNCLEPYLDIFGEGLLV